MRTFAQLLLVIAAGACAPLPGLQAQPKEAQPNKAAPNEPVPGRVTKKIQGFTFLISEEALKGEGGKFDRPPLEVLEYECKLLTELLSPKAVDLLRRLTVFVDWDKEVTVGNGRQGVALATYFGGTAQQATKDGRHPLQAKTVTIHTLKKLTDQRQPRNDARVGCLLLHEFAHAVHDQLFGFDHAGIKAAYEQAMERRLYDKEFYAVTNPREFFAEMTCAYLDRLSYMPHNRDELKRHDPVTFKTMESIWAGSTATGGAKAPPPHAEKRDTLLTLGTDLKFGPTLAGPKAEPGALDGKVVLVGCWGGLQANTLDRLERLRTELGDYGLVVLAAHVFVRDDEVVAADAQKRGYGGTVLQAAFVREGQKFLSQAPGHALVFDPAGKCVYRGSVYEADEAVRGAVGKALLASALGGDEVPAAFKGVADAVATGNPPVSLVPKLAALLGGTDEDVKTKARKLTDLILAPGQKALADAQATAKADPVGALVAAEKVAATFKGTPVGTKAGELLKTLRTDKAVAAELKARAQAAEVEKGLARLRAQEGSFNPLASEFQTKHKQALGQLKAQVEQLRKQYPMARATAAAEKAAAEFVGP